MSVENDRFGTEVAQSIDTIEGSWEIDGESYDLICEDISKKDFDLVGEYFRLTQVEDAEAAQETAENLDDFSWEAENEEEKDAIESVVDEKLKKPEVNVNEAGIRKITALFIGMFQAWQEGSSVDVAKDEMPLDKGNS